MSSRKSTPKPARERFAVIMAGGRGQRFWPLSRENSPKQFLKLLGARTLLQQAVDRLQGLVPEENVFVVTNKAHEGVVRRQAPRLPKANVVGEPCGRDTCAAVALGAALVGAKNPQGTMAVLPADHVIPDAVTFRRSLNAAFDRAAQESEIVTFGVVPTEAATGYGYIELGEPVSSPRGGTGSSPSFYSVKRFLEKPIRRRALAFLKSGKHLWNAGIFVWSFPTILAGLRRHRPELADACERWIEATGTPRWAKVLAEDYAGLERISIDHALLEHAENVVVSKAGFEWDDLGSWPALGRYLPEDSAQNRACADFVQVDSQRNIIFDARKKTRGLVATVGLSDCVVVLCDDATLIAPRARAQDLKALIEKLRAQGNRTAL